jgi:hypothetical protein
VARLELHVSAGECHCARVIANMALYISSNKWGPDLPSDLQILNSTKDVIGSNYCQEALPSYIVNGVWNLSLGCIPKQIGSNHRHHFESYIFTPTGRLGPCMQGTMLQSRISAFKPARRSYLILLDSVACQA